MDPRDESRLLLAMLEQLIEWTSDDSREDQKTDPRLREEFFAVRCRAETVADHARKSLAQKD